jgi:hypothetical protein
MRLYMHHGRLDPDGGATDEDGNEVDDWGFTGPDLPDAIGFHITYGEMRVFFKNAYAKSLAKSLTGWEDGHGDDDLTVPMCENCICRFNAVRQRREYFGDWGLDDQPVRPAVEQAPCPRPVRGAAWDTER